MRLIQLDKESDSSLIVEQLKERARIDRKETCFAGIGKIHTKTLTAYPSDIEKIRKQKFW